MPILKVKKEREELRLVGVHLPPQDYNSLSLYALAMGISKSHLFKELITDWKEHLKAEGITEKTLTQDLTIRINNEWRRMRKLKPRTKFINFKNDVENELIGKGLTLKQVTVIISKINE